MKLRVEYYFDDEACRWGFTVPALHIVGSGATREEAEARAIDAIDYAFEGVADDFDQDDAVHVGYLKVDIKPQHLTTRR